MQPSIIPFADYVSPETLRERDLDSRAQKIIERTLVVRDDPAAILRAKDEINALYGYDPANITGKEKYGIRRGAKITALDYAVMLHQRAQQAIPQPAPAIEKPAKREETPLTDECWGDPHELRIVRGLLKKAWLVLLVARQITRNGSGSGVVTQKAIVQFLLDAGVQVTTAMVHRWVLAGVGKLWNFRRGKLYLFSTTRRRNGKMRGRLNIVQLARDMGREDLIADYDLSGGALVRIPLGRNELECRAHLYRACMSSRKHPFANIGRDALCSQWDVTPKTLLCWERLTNIKMKPVYAEFKTDSEHLTAQRLKRAEPVFYNVAGTTELRARVRWSSRPLFKPFELRQHKQAPSERRRAALYTKKLIRRDVPATTVGEARATTGGSASGQESLIRINFFDGHRLGKPATAHDFVREAVKRTEDTSHPYAAEIGIDPRYRTQTVQITYGEKFTGERCDRRHENYLFEVSGGRGNVLRQLQERAA